MDIKVVGLLPAVTGDADQLERLLINLLGNALDHRSDSRRLSIRIDARREGDYWEILVVDNGTGMAASQLAHVFLPFQQTSSSAGNADPGLALGICKQIALCHDGQLYIRSSTDAGTTFVIRLPAEDWSADKAA